MWANNEVGTLQPIDEVVALAAEHGIPVHTDAVQALGQVPLDFAASGVDAMTVTGHKIGGPFGVGALLLRREIELVALVARRRAGARRPLRHHRRAGDRRLRRRPPSCRSRASPSARSSCAALRDELIAGVLAAVPDAQLNGAPGAGRLPGNAHFSFPGCEGDSLLMLLDAQGIECSTGSACSAGVPQASHVLLAMGRDDDLARGSLRFSLGHTSTRADVDRVIAAIGPAVQRARAAGSVEARRRPLVKVLAAMSGGVDSAVAAARAAEAGHDVTGIHLALSRNPKSYRSGARGCCTIEDSNDARRAADVIGIPFYVWDMSDRFHEDVVEDFMAEYAEGRTPNPCLRCNEKIKFAAVLDRALALGFDAVATGHYAQLVTRRRRPDRDAPRRRPRQGPVVRARRAHPGPAGALDVSARRLAQGRGPRRGRPARAVRGQQARQPRHLLHLRRRHRGLAAREARRGQRPDRRHRRRGARRATKAPSGSPSASAAACASARRRPTASRATCSTSSRSAAP